MLVFVRTRLHITIAAQLLERIFALLVLSSPRPLAGTSMPQLFNDFRHSSRRRLDWKRAGGAAEAAIAFSLAVVKIERNHGDFLAVDVFPNVQLRPMQQRVNADVGALFKISFELVPKLGRLIFDVPLHVFIARAE